MKNIEHRESKTDSWKTVSGIVAGVQAFATLALVVVLLFFGWNMYVAKQKVTSTATAILSGDGAEEKLKAGASKAKEVWDAHNGTERTKAGAKAGLSKLGNMLLDKAPGLTEKVAGVTGVGGANSSGLGAAMDGLTDSKERPFKERLKAGWGRFKDSRAKQEAASIEPQPQYFEMMTPGQETPND